MEPFVIVSSMPAISVTFPGNQSVSGTVNVGTIPNTSVSGTVNIGTLPNASVSGTVNIGTMPNASVSGTVNIGTQSGSVIAFIYDAAGTGLTSTGTSLNVNVKNMDGAASVQSRNVVTRNDAVASFLGADLTPRLMASDSAGRLLVKPFAAEEARVEGYVTTTNTSITTLVAAAGAGLRNYITDIWLANTGAATTLVTFSSGGGASVLGYTIAPTGSGSNLQGLATPIRTGVNETFGIQAATATSILYATVKGYKAP